MRTYLHPDLGIQVPSVTTILSATQPQAMRRSLDQFYANNPNALQKNQLAKERGTAVDTWAYQFLCGKNPTIDYRFAPYAEVLRPALQVLLTADDLWMQHVVYGDHYAGTLDIAVRRGDRWRIIDIKTKDKYWKDSVQEAYLQLMAYSLAFPFPVQSFSVYTATAKQLYINEVTEPALMETLTALWKQRLTRYYAQPQPNSQDY